MPTQIDTHFWATYKNVYHHTFTSLLLCRVPQRPRAERIDYTIFCHYFVVCLLSFFHFILFLFSTRRGTAVRRAQCIANKGGRSV